MVMGAQAYGGMMSKGLARLAGKSFVLRIIAAGMTYVFVVALARMMTVEDFGVVGTLMSGALLFSVVGCVGQRMALLRFVPPLIEAPDAPIPLSFISRSIRLALSGNVVMYACLVAAAFIGQDIGRVDHAGLITLGLLIVPLTGLIDMQAHLARAYRSIVLAIAPKDILWRLMSLAVISAVFFLRGDVVSLWVVLPVLVGVLLLLIAGQGILMKRWLGVPSLTKAALMRPAEPKDPAWSSTRFPLWITSITAILFTNLDVVMAGVMIGPEAAALYFSANRIAMVPGLFLISYNIVVGPVFSGHFAAGRTEDLKQVSRAASLQVFVPTLVVVAGLFVFAGPILSLFGPEFTQSIPILRWLLLAALVNGVMGPNDLMLNMCGEERRAMRVALLGMCVGGSMVFIGAWTQDPTTLAMCTFAAIAFMRLLSWFMVRRSLHFSADAVTALCMKFKNRGTI